jgi:hypothetical protein
MSAYLFTFRTPVDYSPTADAFEAWSRWQLGLGARLKDRGNPAFTAATLGASVEATTLGGYSVIRATSLDEALELARECPMLRQGGTVEIGELDSHDERFDQWLSEHVGS